MGVMFQKCITVSSLSGTKQCWVLFALTHSNAPRWSRNDVDGIMMSLHTV